MAGSLGFNASGELQVSGTVLTKNTGYKSTPITVTSWSYLTTTITLNVASHTFVAGDYIEVGGLTATTNVPNGVHLVTSVTATTIVFTYALTPTGTAGVSSATVKGYMTTNGRVVGIGVGQTRQNVTGSRALGVTYTNTTEKPIVVIITLIVPYSGDASYIDFKINGVVSSRVGDVGGTNYAFSIATTLTEIVQPGDTYSAVAVTVGVATTIFSWQEIR